MLFRGIPVFIDSRADLYAPEFNKKRRHIHGLYKHIINCNILRRHIQKIQYNTRNSIWKLKSKYDYQKTNDENYKNYMKTTILSYTKD